MNNLAKRSLALILALVLCLSLLPVTVVPVSAASYIYNWGTRGEVATSLSAYAQAFYTGSNTYDALSALAGGTSKDNAPNSNLYKALQSLMVNAHSHETSYDETKDLFMYTDCQNGGGKISTFYSGTEVGPEWISGGKVWNREHTWPDSKGDASGNGENDIMMLRPADASLNSSRGNTAYGESTGYYDPNSVSGGKYNLHGDVARIMLYVYVRWGNTGSMWGSSGVIESLDVLVDWMEEDPVDTWEMGRNDSVQSITGTRNVFVDYPELAFQLFGEEVPADMTTPSSNTAPHTHTYVNGVCSGCGAAETVMDKAPATKTYEKATSIAVGDTVVLVCGDKNMELSAISTTSTKYGIGVAYSGVPAGAMPLSVVEGASAGTVAFKTEDGKYLYWTSGNSLNVNATLNANTSWTVTFDASGNAVIQNAKDSARKLQWNASNPRFACYTSGQTAVQLYKFGAGSTEEPDQPVCEHTNTKSTTVDATCTKEGSTIVTCVDCNETVETIVIAVLGHNYVDGVCAVCGVDDPYAGNDVLAAFTFMNGTSGQWKDGNEMADATATYTDSGYTLSFTDYSKVFAGGWDTYNKGFIKFGTSSVVGTLTFTVPDDVTSVELHLAKYKTNTTKYSINGGDAVALTKSANDGEYDVVTVDTTENKTITLSTVSGGVRMVMYAVIYKGAATTCAHTNTTVEGAVEATCTEDGYSGDIVCDACGVTVIKGETIAASHKYVDGACDVCGEGDPSVNPEEPEVPVVPSEPTVATSIASGTAYKLGLFSTSKNATYYFTGAMSSYYGATETAYEAGIDVFVEETDGGYYLYFIDAGSTKQYINLVASGTHKNFTFNTTETSVYTWDAEKNALCTTVGDEVCYIGTYGSYVTMSVLQTSKLKDTDYIARLYTMGGSSDPDAPVCEHTNTNVVDAADATCTAKGHTGKTVCDDCGATVNAGSVIDYLPHAYENGACAACGVKAPETAVATKQAYKFGMIQYNVSPTKLYYLTGAMDGYYMATTSVADEAVDVYVEETESGYYLYTYINTVKHYINMVISNGHVNGAFEVTASTVYTFDAEKNTLVATVNDGLYRFGTRNDKEFTTVGPVLVEYNGFYCQLYKFVEGNPNEPTCQHTNTKVEGAADATCTAEGHTGATVCVDCGVTVNAGEVIGKLDHNYVEGVCSACGAEEPVAAATATITFDDKAKRTEFDTSHQVWVENGITVTNNKAASTTNVGDYSNPARFYKSSDLKIEYPNMIQIEFNCTGLESKYVTAFESIEGATVSNGIVTITFAEPVDEFVITGLSAQARANSITITAAAAGETPEEPACQHTNTKVEGAADATCTAEGYTGDTVCAACGEILVPGEVIPVTEHTYVDGVCSSCGAEKPAATTTVTITFDNVNKIADFVDTSHIIWEENNIVVTNSKGGYTNKLAQYAAPARFYAKTGLKIEYVGMTQLVFNCNNASYATALANSIGSAAVVEGKIVTVTLNAAQDVYEIASLSAQVRVDSITITASEAGETPVCEEHSFVEGVCSVCGHKLGDIDGNETLTHEDAVYLLLYTMFPENYPLNGAYVNVDGDQDVDQDDAVYLLLNVLFGDDFYPLQIIAVLPENEEEAEG